MVEFLREEYLNAGSALVQTFKDGTPYVTKTKVKDRHPFIKDSLADFVRANPEVLEEYKKLQGAKGPLKSDDFDEGFDERAFASVLKTKLQDIEMGNAAAEAYHSFAMGVCIFLFYPDLIYPIKEFEMHNGRKRVDIKFTNSSESGFFHTMLAGAQTRAISVLIECKNYEKQLNNPELDQLSGRFGHQRGFFGMLLCRRMDDRQRIVERCRDAACDGRGYMLVLEDTDLMLFLAHVENGERERIDRELADRFQEISH